MHFDIEVSSGRKQIIKIIYIVLMICQKIKFHFHHHVFHDVWSAWFCLVFRNYPTKGKLFLNKYIWHEMWFSLPSLSQTFLISGRRQRDIITHAFRSSSKRQYVCQILSKVEFSPHLSIEFLSLKVLDNPLSGSRIFPWGEVQKFSADKVRRV
jgi:hypothetical protein